MQLRTDASLNALEAEDLGYHEGPNNDNKFGKRLGANHEPWCAAFQSCKLLDDGIKGHVSMSAQALVESFPTGHKFRKAALVGYHIPGGHAGINHVGKALAISKDGKFVHAREGNTRDMVADRIRPIEQVVAFGYIHFDTTKPVPAPNTPASLTPGHPLHHTRVVCTKDSTLWNGRIGTKRGTVHAGPTILHRFDEPPVMHGGLRYDHVAWGGKNATGGANDGWVRYDHLKYV